MCFLKRDKLKMPAKKWIICGECQYLNECKTGQNKMRGISPQSFVYNEIGCYNYKQYFQQIDGRQLKLF